MENCKGKFELRSPDGEHIQYSLEKEANSVMTTERCNSKGHHIITVYWTKEPITGGSVNLHP